MPYIACGRRNVVVCVLDCPKKISLLLLCCMELSAKRPKGFYLHMLMTTYDLLVEW